MWGDWQTMLSWEWWIFFFRKIPLSLFCESHSRKFPWEDKLWNSNAPLRLCHKQKNCERRQRRGGLASSLLRWCQNNWKTPLMTEIQFLISFKLALTPIFSSSCFWKPEFTLKAVFVWGIWWFSLNFRRNLEKNVGLCSSGISPDICSLLDCSCAAEFQHVSLAALLSGCVFQQFMKTTSRLTTCHKSLFFCRLHSDSSFMLKLHGFVPEKVLNHLASLNKEAIKVHISYFKKETSFTA